MTERMVVEFQQFWARYPHKVAKLSAAKAYVKARTQASAEELLDGLDRYIASKPAWCEWAHAATWLRAGRWMDEITPRQASHEWTCPHTPACHSRHWCGVMTTKAQMQARGEW